MKFKVLLRKRGGVRARAARPASGSTSCLDLDVRRTHRRGPEAANPWGGAFWNAEIVTVICSACLDLFPPVPRDSLSHEMSFFSPCPVSCEGVWTLVVKFFSHPGVHARAGFAFLLPYFCPRGSRPPCHLETPAITTRATPVLLSCFNGARVRGPPRGRVVVYPVSSM